MRAIPLAAVLFATACATEPAAVDAARDDALIRAIVAAQQPRIEAFFGGPLPRPFELHVCAHRDEFAALAKQRWQMDQLPCWAVAIGTGSTLAVLTPSVWRSEACEHDPADLDALRLLLAHELVHVWHGQHRSDPEFFQADDAGWWVEGLAVFASGQLDAARVDQARKLVAAGKGPNALANAWSGNARYAIAGTLARHVDRQLGRARTVALLNASTSAEVLAALGTTEAQLLADWRAELVPAEQPSR